MKRKDKTMMMIVRPNGETAQTTPDNMFFNQTLLKDHVEIDTPHWSFVIFSPKRVIDLYFNLERGSVTNPLKHAYEQELGIIAICKGDYVNPTWVPLTPGLDVEKIKKEWSLELFEKHRQSAGGHIQ